MIHEGFGKNKDNKAIHNLLCPLVYIYGVECQLIQGYLFPLHQVWIIFSPLIVTVILFMLASVSFNF